MAVRTQLLALAAGALFAAGLALSGMTRPGVVVGFLDVGGDWDPRLAFVMGGALAVHAVAYRLRGRFPQPLLGGTWALPTRTDVDWRLLGGAALFGVGWGISGYCPGPAVVALPTLATPTLVFGAAMLTGMAAFSAVERWLAPAEPTSDAVTPPA